MISGLTPLTLNDFNFGRVTTQNHTEVPENALLVGKNLILNNGAPQSIPGYSSIQKLPLTRIVRMYPFERQSDKKLFFVVTGDNAAGKSSIILAPIDGKAFNYIILSAVETSADFDFITSVHSLYLVKSDVCYKIVNVDGTETLVAMGLQAPAAAPTIAIGGGTLVLDLGARYVYSEVFRWIDSLGVSRYHIGPPSDFSAHSGVLGRSVGDADITSGAAVLHSATANFAAGDVGKTVIVSGAGAAGVDLTTVIDVFTDASHVTLHVNAATTVANAIIKIDPKAVTVGNLVKANPQTTHFWIFRTPNSQIGASGTYNFVAEISSAVNQYSDQIDDLNLDTTRTAPFDNLPPDPSSIMLEWNKRAVLMHGNEIDFSAVSETPLGIPYESFPDALRFIIPGGVKQLTAGQVFNRVLFAATEDYWFAIRGTTQANFDEEDRVVYPGCVGRKCCLVIHGKLVWLARDKKLWSWTGVEGDDAVPASVSIHQDSEDQLSMDDLSQNFLSQCELQWYSNGTHDVALLVAPSKKTKAGEKDWIQVWDLSPVTGVKTIQGPLPQPALTDFFPLHQFACSALAKDGGIPYIYFGDQANGTVYRWPDGTDFAGEVIDTVMGSTWVNLSKKNASLFTLQLLTDTNNAKDLFKVMVVATNGINQQLKPIAVELEAVVDGRNEDTTTCIAKLQGDGTAFGNWVKVFVFFPRDNASHTVQAIELKYKPLKG